jgi:hypothetical protein
MSTLYFEVIQSHSARRSITKMIRFYEDLIESGKFKGYVRDFYVLPLPNFRLLIVRTSPVRLENMRSFLGASNSPKRYRFFWLTPFDQVDTDTVLSLIGASLDQCDERTYSIGASGS